MAETTDALARAAFAADGFVRVPDVVASAEVAAMRACVWDLLAAHGIVEGDRSTWSVGGSLPLVELVGALRPGPSATPLLWEVGRLAAFDPLPAALARAVDRVFGAGMWAPLDDERGGLAAPNLPLRDVPWNVPDAAWHVDEPTAAGQPDGWGLLGFAFLDVVEPGGGATVAIAGSPRLLGQLAAARAQPAPPVTTEDAIAALRDDGPWFADLFRPGDPDERQRRFLNEPHVAHGIPLRVVELTGQPGDIVLMDPRCLHTVSANISGRARMTMRMTCARLPWAR